ncbi:MAG: spore germination protein [Oscillospiraceae bacterium]
MNRFFSRAHTQEQQDAFFREKTASMNSVLGTETFDTSVAVNAEKIRALFKDVDSLVVRELKNPATGLDVVLCFCECVVEKFLINESLIKPLLSADFHAAKPSLSEYLQQSVLTINDIYETDQLPAVIESLTTGDTILFAQGSDKAVIVNTKGFVTRAIVEPESEKIVSGPHDGFNESLVQSLSLLRRRIRSNRLKMKYRTVGRMTNTKICICYIEGVVEPAMLDELYKRLDRIHPDSLMDSYYIQEQLKDRVLTPFQTIGSSERPDVVASRILEGKIALFVDGSPMVLTMPFYFIENFHNCGDYYINLFMASFTRLLRMIGVTISVLIPGLYIAIVAFQHEVLPTPLLINITAERSNVPLPAGLEIIVMLFMFDILLESGVRMPNSIGQTLSIVGALVIGQAAVQAKLIAAPMIIIISLTGITALLVPKMYASVVFMRTWVLLLSITFGTFGFILASMVVIIHILNLKTLGIPYANASGVFSKRRLRDMIIRAPISTLKQTDADCK